MTIEIDQALIQTFVNGAFGLPIAHENQQYTPTAGTAYVEIRVLQNDATPFTLKDSDETDGVFRVRLFYPADTGAVNAKSKADEIFATYKIGTRLTYNNVSLTVMSNQRQPGLAEDGWYQLVLTINYRAYVAR